MHKKWLIISIAVLLLAGVCLSVCACKGTPNKDNIPVTDWRDYLYDIASAIDAQFLKVETNEAVTCDFNIDIIDADNGDKYECALKLNLDFQNKNSQQGVLNIEKVVGNHRQTYLQLYNDGDLLYWQIYDEDNGQYVRNRYDKAPLLYSLTKVVGLFGEDINYSTMGVVFILFGRVFFSDATANADHSVYTFDFDLKKGLDSAITRETFAKLPELLQKLFFSLAKVENYEDMLSKTPSLKGKININISDGKLSSISSEELALQDVEKNKKFKFDMSRIYISNGKDESIVEFYPDDGEYEDKRLFEATTLGVVRLENTLSNRVEMQYDYEFRAKLDLLKLISEDWDLTKLDEDNFFHMRVSHICNSQCGAFCKDKYDPAKGAIFDVAFSPKDFGNYDVYISVGLRALIGSRVIKQFFNISESLLNTQIPEYWLTVISAETLIRQISRSIEGSEEEENTIGEELLLAFIYKDNGLSAPIEKVLQVLGMSSEAASSLMSVFRCDNYQIDTMTVEQTYYRQNVSSYDIKRSAIHLYGNDAEGTKQYTKGFISRPPALNYLCQSQKAVEGDNTYDVVTLHDEIYVDGALYGADIPISADETERIAGSYVYARAEDIYGEQFEAQLYVVDHSSIDLQYGGWQKIELYCIPTGRGYFDGKVWEALRKFSWSRWLCKTVATYIKLDNVEDVDYGHLEKSEYMQGEKLSGDDTPEKISAVINYKGGKRKSIYLNAANANELLLTDYVGNRYIGANKDTVLQFYLFGKYYGEMVRIKPAKDIVLKTSAQELSLEQSDIGYSSQLRVGILQFTLADGSVVELTLTVDYLKINGYSIDEDNEYFYVNPTSSTKSIIINKIGRYTLTFFYADLEKSIPLYILPKSEKRDESKYKIENTTNVNSHYFEGYTYAFSAGISNTYHGEWGVSTTISIQVLRGYISSSGTLLYQEPTEEEQYFNISEIRVDNNIVDNSFAIDLPPTLYDAIAVRTRILFLKSGYYKVRIKMGASYCEQEIIVEKTFE